jgi:hypothetical protein
MHRLQFKEACEKFSNENVYGSLGIIYADGKIQAPFHSPFLILLDKNNPVHIFDSQNLPTTSILLGHWKKTSMV